MGTTPTWRCLVSRIQSGTKQWCIRFDKKHAHPLNEEKRSDPRYLASRLQSGTKQYYIQVSIDGVKWHRAHRGGLKPATDGCLSCLPTPSQLALLTKCEEARYIRFRTLSSYPGGKGISSIRVFAQKGIRYILPLVYPIGAIDSIRTSRSQDAFTGTLQMPESSPAAPSLVSRMLTYGEISPKCSFLQTIRGARSPRSLFAALIPAVRRVCQL